MIGEQTIVFHESVDNLIFLVYMIYESQKKTLALFCYADDYSQMDGRTQLSLIMDTTTNSISKCRHAQKSIILISKLLYSLTYET